MFGEPLPLPYLTDQVAKNAFLSLGAGFLAGALAVPLCGLFVSLLVGTSAAALIFYSCMGIAKAASKNYYKEQVAFFKACEKGSPLESTQYNPELLDKNGNSPLHYACRGKQKEAAKNLFLWGADIRAKNGKGKTPLMLNFDIEFTVSLLTDDQLFTLLTADLEKFPAKKAATWRTEKPRLAATLVVMALGDKALLKAVEKVLTQEEIKELNGLDKGKKSP